MSAKKLNELQKELHQLQSGFTDVVQALGFLQGFIESEFGMRFQFQAYKSSSPVNEQLSNSIRTLQAKHLNQNQNKPSSCPNTSLATNCQPIYSSTPAPGHSFPQHQQQQHHINIQYAGPANESFTNQLGTYHQTYNYNQYQANQHAQPQQPFEIKIQTVEEPGTSHQDEDSYDGGDDEMPDQDSSNPGQNSTDGAPSGEEGTVDALLMLNSPEKKKKRTRSKVPDPNKWNRRMQLKARERGEAYFGSTVVERENGKKQYMLASVKPARKLGGPCTSIQCQKTKLRNCGKFTEADRQRLFNEFWKEKSWDEKKSFVCANVDRKFPKQPKVNPSTSNRAETLYHHLPLNGKRLRVCRQLFVSTIGIGKSMLSKWVKGMAEAPPESERPVFKIRKKYTKQSERVPKVPKDGGWKCPYCLEISQNKNDFHSHMAKHMEQYAWSD